MTVAANIKIPIASIQRDRRTQVREATDGVVAAQYAARIEEGDEFPAVIVFFDGTRHWLADGYHRLDAHEQVGRTEILAEVRPGSLRDAILFSLSANAKHPLRMTNADKRRAVLTMLADEEWAGWSDREIARRAGVTHPFVGKLRAERAGSGGNGYQLPAEPAEPPEPPTLDPLQWSPDGRLLCQCGKPMGFPGCLENSDYVNDAAREAWIKEAIAHYGPAAAECFDRDSHLNLMWSHGPEQPEDVRGAAAADGDPLAVLFRAHVKVGLPDLSSDQVTVLTAGRFFAYVVPSAAEGGRYFWVSVIDLGTDDDAGCTVTCGKPIADFAVAYLLDRAWWPSHEAMEVLTFPSEKWKASPFHKSGLPLDGVVPSTPPQ